MAQLWARHDGQNGWQRIPLRQDDLPLVEGAGAVRLHRLDEHAGWLLLAAPAAAIRVNGLTPPAGCQLLRDHDELRLGCRLLFYAAAERGQVTPAPAVAAAGLGCARCGQAIAPGSAAVCCPRCGLWHHQVGNDLACWTYAETCAQCPQSTELGGGEDWTPGADPWAA